MGAYAPRAFKFNVKERSEAMNFNKAMTSLSGISIGTVSLLAAISVVAVILVCLIVMKIIMTAVGHIQEHSKLDNTLKGFIRSAIKTGLWVITVIIVADKLGIQTSSLVAIVSVAGLALSLALQGVLSNLFSGLTTLATKPFSSGDFVELDGVSGTVGEMGLFYTTMTTSDNKTIYIPNNHVASTKIINYTRQKNRRIDLTFNVPYETSTEEVKKLLMDGIRAEKRILEDPAPFVGLQSYEHSSIEFVLRVWVKSEDYGEVSFSLNESMRELFLKRGIAMMGDHLNVHVVK